ncbi:nucleotidyl transferase AbiEii/AbiGii toxin family protein [Bifidobacterium sp. ESL0769]|uniref:nucleotidyl transferase AbiEii/AbiGii toxin family protein n=1 Tax=Bifidobacterium sp. ESL0769 TaxID=2983229 RepID=UPI0023F9A7B5|nr:nucleotidyl transferase AbiEii/AbiGii toxin family protein [Bifidobacterium sp. ESL0769]WEV67935.1 nucleotidyl transferase AbiEii/AbiGii toxin family protein [Bifidobacterium sp. ESL0769]
MNQNKDASLRGKVRSLAQRNHLSAQEVLQMVIFDHFLERLSHSNYSDKFIIKGGLLVSSLSGISSRTTMDLDATILGIKMEETRLTQVIEQICNIDLDDGFSFSFERLEPIREHDVYADFRAHLHARFGRINAPLKLDLTTGDAITPEPVDYGYRTLFENKTIQLKAYPIETLIAEKFETIMRRGTENGRARDFYDLDILYRRYSENLDPHTLRQAITNTANHRGSLAEINNFRQICSTLQNSEYLKQDIWKPYVKANPYANSRSFEDTINSVLALGNLANL